MSANDDAKRRAERRAKDKAERAATSGIILPAKKRKKRGWEILREGLRQGTLLPNLKRITDATIGRRRSSLGGAGARKSVATSVMGFFGLEGWALTRKSGSKMTAKQFLLEAKAAHDKTTRKRVEREERRKLIKKQKKLERELEYLNFPTMLGWYFDGFFTPYFQLNEEYAHIFNEMELEISKNKESLVKETFAERAKRYFWPPEILMGFCFRTRGIYLDFREIMKDPPHTPPEVVLDQRVEAVTLFVGSQKSDIESKVASDELLTDPITGEPITAMTATQLAVEEARTQKMMKQIDDDPNMTDEQKAIKKRALLFSLQKKKQRSRLQEQIAEEMHFKSINKNNYYFDDQVPGFFHKRARDRDKYYFDQTWDVWRIKRKIILFPNDFFWDEQLALFFPKDRTRPPDYYIFDPNIAAYRVAGDNTPPNWRGIRPVDFFFDHKLGKWVKKSKVPAGTSPFFDQNSFRFCINKTKSTPDDFYYDIVTLQFEKKVGDGGKQYFYDPQFGAWRHVNTPLPPKGSPKPIDFYWNEVENMFKRKDAPASFFVWDQNSNFFRKKRSLHGKYHPKNWTWVEKTKQWQLKKPASRQPVISDSLYWRPDRDYDKPWLEYVGGFREYQINYDYADIEEDDGKSSVAGRTGKTELNVTQSGTKAGIGGGGMGPVGPVGIGGKKLQFSTSEPAMKTSGIAAGKGVKMEPEKDDHGILRDGLSDSETSTKPSVRPSLADMLQYVDTMDRKTLKVTNLGFAVNELDLRKYFASVKKVIRPNVPGSELLEDYAYLKFKTDEAAAAALKTMDGQKIRGQRMNLHYKPKAEDETVGGQRDTGLLEP